MESEWGLLRDKIGTKVLQRRMMMELMGKKDFGLIARGGPWYKAHVWSFSNNQLQSYNQLLHF